MIVSDFRKVREFVIITIECKTFLDLLFYVIIYHRIRLATARRSQYKTGTGGYYLKFLSDRRKTFFLSLGLSALAGYETSNRSEKLLPDGSTLLDKDCFIYGGALTLELEAYLTDRVALLLNARERALFGSDIGKFHTQVSLGLKFIIN